MKHIQHRLLERLIYLQKTLDFQKQLQESLDFFLHPNMEFHLYLNDKGEYELHEIKMLPTPSKARELRGFVFERGGKRVVSCWHTSGEGSVKIALGEGGKNISLRIAGRRYIETDLSASEVEANFAAAVME